MKNERLFYSNGSWITSSDILAALEKVQAQDCRVLFMHTGISFGIPNPELRRNDLLQELYSVVKELGVATLCVPTYTFSFCNGRDYDIAHSRSYMGALNEYIRHQPETLRSLDPMMSVALVGEDCDLVLNLGNESIGENSTFDKLSRRKGVKFLFFGVGLGDCFTYMHYLEWLAKVPYRYSRDFYGKITQRDKTWEDKYSLFVRYNNVKPNDASFEYGNKLIDTGLLHSVTLGNSSIACVDERDAKGLYLSILENDPYHFIRDPFNEATKDDFFSVQNMISL